MRTSKLIKNDTDEAMWYDPVTGNIYDKNGNDPRTPKDLRPPSTESVERGSDDD